MADSEKPQEEGAGAAPAEVPAAKDEQQADIEEIDISQEGQGDDETKGKLRGLPLPAEMFRDPSVLAALQGRLGQMMGASSGYIESLPKVVKRRVKALKKLQNEVVNIESKFYEEVHNLECKYQSQYAPLFERRRDILMGEIEPTDSDCEWPSDEEEDEEEKLAVSPSKQKDSDMEQKAKIEDEVKGEEKPAEGEDGDNTKGIPDFWLTIFKNVDMLNDMMQEHDEPIIKHLQDIKIVFEQGPPTAFKLEFVFSENEYFTEKVLTKRYLLRTEPEEKDPLSYEGPEIIKCEGCTINWKSGKNVTVKTVKKKQKHKGRGTVRTVTKTIPNDSFFNFFNPPEAPEDEEDEEGDDDVETLLAADFEIGHFIRERIVPRAVLYFTGEALDDDEDYDEEDDDEDGGDDDDDEDQDADYDPNTDQAKPADCKQS